MRTNLSMPYPAPYRIERPKVVWNEQYGYYAMLWHLDTPDFSFPAVGVATSPTLTGPFTYRRVFQPDHRPSYDMTVFQPAGSRDAYLVRSVENRFLGISKLSDDYLDTTGLCSTAGMQPGARFWCLQVSFSRSEAGGPSSV